MGVLHEMLSRMRGVFDNRHAIVDPVTVLREAEDTFKQEVADRMHALEERVHELEYLVVPTRRDAPVEEKPSEPVVVEDPTDA